MDFLYFLIKIACFIIINIILAVGCVLILAYVIEKVNNYYNNDD